MFFFGFLERGLFLTCQMNKLFLKAFSNFEKSQIPHFFVEFHIFLWNLEFYQPGFDLINYEDKF